MEPTQFYGTRALADGPVPASDALTLEQLFGQSGLKDGAIAGRLDVNYTTLARLRKDPRKLKVQAVRQLAGIFRVPVEYLFACVLLTIEQLEASERQASEHQAGQSGGAVPSEEAEVKQ